MQSKYLHHNGIRCLISILLGFVCFGVLHFFIADWAIREFWSSVLVLVFLALIFFKPDRSSIKILFVFYMGVFFYLDLEPSRLAISVGLALCFFICLLVPS